MILREREGEGGGVKWQRKMSRGRERMIIYSLIRVIQDIRHKYIKHRLLFLYLYLVKLRNYAAYTLRLIQVRYVHCRL